MSTETEPDRETESAASGMKLLSELSLATELPSELIGEELSRLLASAGKTPESVTLDELRDLLASYLQDVLVEAKNGFAQGEVPVAGSHADRSSKT